MAVVFYHAFPEYLKGGFIGVDIFFVISGFLISSILYRHLFSTTNPGKINLVDFYIRRVRRIFPALLAVLITSLVLGYFVLLPDEYKLLGKHTLGGSVYINNLMLYDETGDYFNASSNAKPLLHLWSLGVEEQFYLIFPILLFILYKTNLNFVLSLTIFTVVSFCLNRNGVNHHQQTASFYLPWCRFWELSLGAILAYVVNYYSALIQRIQSSIICNKITFILSNVLLREYSEKSRKLLFANLLSLLGLITIFVGVFCIKNDTNFPGTRALVPVLGAVMIIGAGKEAFINKKLLSNPIMVYLGLISYPLYLWHWPLLSFAFICEGQIPATWIRVSAIFLSIFLSVITFTFIEPSLRYGAFAKTKAIALFVLLLGVGFIGYRIYALDGLPKRFPEMLTIDEDSKKFEEYMNKGYNECIQEYPEWGNDYRWWPNECVINRGNKNSIFLVGDSHAAHLMFGLWSIIHKNSNFGLIEFVNNSNVPFLGLIAVHRDPTIAKHNRYRVPIKDQAIYDSFKDDNVKIYVMAHYPSEDSRMMDLNGNEILFDDPYSVYKKYAENTFYIFKQNNKKILFILTNPTLPFDPTSCKGRPFSITLQNNCQFDRSIYDNNQRFSIYNKAIKDVAVNYDNVTILDLSKYFCDDRYCYVENNGSNLYLKDGGHLNYQGSRFVSSFIYNKIKELIK